jgi:hypothetical protein
MQAIFHCSHFACAERTLINFIIINTNNDDDDDSNINNNNNNNSRYLLYTCLFQTRHDLHCDIGFQRSFLPLV